MVGVCKSWTHMHCFQNTPQATLKFHQTRYHGFLCPSCYSSGYTFRLLCVHLMNAHSSEDLVKMGVSTIHVARGAGGLFKDGSEPAYQACSVYMAAQMKLIGRTSRTPPTPPSPVWMPQCLRPLCRRLMPSSCARG